MKVYLGCLHGLLAAIILLTFAPNQAKGGNMSSLLTACTIQVMLKYTVQIVQAGGYASHSASSESPRQHKPFCLLAVDYECVLEGQPTAYNLLQHGVCKSPAGCKAWTNCF